MTCPECGHSARKYGLRKLRKGLQQQYHCDGCGKNWSVPVEEPKKEGK